MTNMYDAELQRHLTRMQRAMDGLIATQTRAVAMPLPSKMPLTLEMADKLTPVMENLYWHPLRNGIDAAPDGDKELESWLRSQLSNAAVVAALLALLIRYQKRAVNMAGSIALELMKLGKEFNLTNPAYVKEIEDRSITLVTAGSDMSLIDTTVGELAIAIPAARNSTSDTLAVLGAYITARAVTRAAGIATFEAPWGFNRGLTWTYKENGVKRLMYDVNGVGCPEICAPLHGRTFPIDNVPAGLEIPRHPNCDCIYSRADDSWTKPDEVWKGG